MHCLAAPPITDYHAPSSHSSLGPASHPLLQLIQSFSCTLYDVRLLHVLHLRPRRIRDYRGRRCCRHNGGQRSSAHWPSDEAQMSQTNVKALITQLQCVASLKLLLRVSQNYVFTAPGTIEGQGVSRKVNLRMGIGPRTYYLCFTPNNFYAWFFGLS